MVEPRRKLQAPIAACHRQAVHPHPDQAADRHSDHRGTGSEVTPWAPWDRGAGKYSLHLRETWAEAAWSSRPTFVAALGTRGGPMLFRSLESIWNVNATPVRIRMR
jgi:hypothetical protein